MRSASRRSGDADRKIYRLESRGRPRNECAREDQSEGEEEAEEREDEDEEVEEDAGTALEMRSLSKRVARLRAKLSTLLKDEVVPCADPAAVAAPAAGGECDGVAAADVAAVCEAEVTRGASVNILLNSSSERILSADLIT